MIEKKKAIRKDSLKNKAKVIKAVLKDPLATQKELAKTIGISKGCVNKNMQELEQTGPLAEKDDRILGVCDDDFEIIKLTQGETIRRIKEEPQEVSTSDLIRAGSESTKRYSLFKGDATDKQGGLKELSKILASIQE